MKNLILGLVCLIFAIASCTKEQIVTKIVNDTINVTSGTEVAVIQDSLLGTWPAIYFTVTHMKGNESVKDEPNYFSQNICAILDTLLPDKNIVNTYVVSKAKNFKNSNQLMVIKNYQCSTKTDTLYWEIQLNYDVNFTGQNYIKGANGKSFLILEKDAKQNVNLVYAMRYFNLGLQSYQYQPVWLLTLENTYNSVFPAYQYLKFEIAFSKTH